MSDPPNFQDVVVLSSDTLNAGVERLVLGSSAGSKSIVFAQDVALASAMHLVASNPTAVRTAILPDANGTLGYLTAVSAGTTAITNGQVVFGNSNIAFGINGSTLTMAMSTISGFDIGVDNGTAVVNPQITLNATSTLASTALASGLRVFFPYPINITYIDPRGLPRDTVSGSSVNQTATLSVTWWCGLYTISGSTAGVVSSASNSGSISEAGGVVTTGQDRRFTNITWNVTPGDYMFFTGFIASLSANAAGAFQCTGKVGISVVGVVLPEVSYSVPYWWNGSVSASATSYHLTDLVNSGGVGAATNYPYIKLIGS